MKVALDTSAYSALMNGHRDVVALTRHFGAVDGLAWLSFSPAQENSVREQVRRYHAVREG